MAPLNNKAEDKTMSLTRSEQSRLNGAKSRGPVTVEGKARSAQNATKHGIFAKFACLAWEDRGDFELHCEDFTKRLKPTDEVELNLVEKIIHCTWRQQRLLDVETTLLDMKMAEMDTHYEIDVPQHRRNLAQSFVRNKDTAEAIDRVARLEAHLDRIIARAYRTLDQLRKNHPIPENEPETLSTPPVDNENPENEPETSALPPRPPCLSGESSPKPENEPEPPPKRVYLSIPRHLLYDDYPRKTAIPQNEPKKPEEAA
jgi:hypothetical protein